MSELAPPHGNPRKAAVETAEPFGPLRALLLAPAEDSEPLAEALRAGGFDELIAERVDSRDALLRVLKPDAWDVAICQDGVASLDGPAALRLIKEACPDLPVIIVSSLFGESIAAAAMKAFKADGITVQQFNEPAGGQVVFHLHMHVMPRHNGVALLPPASRKEDGKVLEENAAKLMAALK